MNYRTTRIKAIASLFFAISLLISFNTTAAEIKIGYVQVDKILRDAPQTKTTGKKLEKEFSPRSKELEALAKKIQGKEASLDKEALTITESAKRKKERSIQNLTTEFQRKQRELREDINLRKNEELAKLQERVNKAVKAVAEAEKYDLIVYGGVAYANGKVDITDKVLKSLGKK